MLKSFKEYMSSTINTASQRISNPVIGAFSLSWCAFNWKSLLYLFLSDSGIIDKITYISDNSNLQSLIIYPVISVIVLCGCLPWINNFISAWQAKPLDNNDSIENHRKAKRIHRATRLQRLQAKHDVTYEKIKTGAEKDIQTMKEQITESQSRMGELTAEKEKLTDEIRELKNEIIKKSIASDRFRAEAAAIKALSEQHKKQISELTQELDILRSNGYSSAKSMANAMKITIPRKNT
ncbi:hypothetical protein D7O10_10285 [Salmonella enterica subsp. enterica serovar Braenderup]|nr:hypothetical protein [Salmonella enterica subsp. enterica serovar Braenderup]ECD3088240.1 hypothetical protein [Salmonella enterica subsp. enterica serovar Braenderup]